MALVPKEHAPSDNESDTSADEECNTHRSSSPALSIGSLEKLNISIYSDSGDEGEAILQQDSTLISHDTIPQEQIIEHPEKSTFDEVPLTPILQEIQECNYENVPSHLSSIPSVPSTSSKIYYHLLQGQNC